MKTKHSLVRVLPLYVIDTKHPDDSIDMEVMEGLGMTPAPILWCYEGTYWLVPMEHVADVLDAVRRHSVLKETPSLKPTVITMADATELDYKTGWALSRRPS